MRAYHEDSRTVAGRCGDRGHRPVDPAIHALERIADRTRDLGVVRGMGRVVQMPALMARAVRFREDLDEQIPRLLREEVQREFDLLVDRRLERRHELVEGAGRRANPVAVRG